MSAGDVVNVATAGDPEVALVSFLAATFLERRLVFAGIGHDPWCPCLVDRRPLAACTCEIVEVEVREP